MNMTRYHALSLCAGTIAFAAGLSDAAAQGTIFPTGSYAQTCSGVSVRDDTLSATCRKLNGASQTSSLGHLASCLNSLTKDGDIGNIDGNLACIPDLPKPDPLFTFPTPETVINGWVFGGNEDAIYRHGWGLWAGLTQPVGVIDGVELRAFETWATPENMKFRMQSGRLLAKTAESVAADRPHITLEVPRQFGNLRPANKIKLFSTVDAPATPVGDPRIFVSVGYNPPAAQHAIGNKLFLQSTLDTLLREGYGEVPSFPSNAITIKPVYKVIPGGVPNGIYTFPGWPGTPTPAKAFPESDWGSCVYVDIKGSGKGGSGIDVGCKGRNAANTFVLSNFIHQKIGKEDAAYLSAQLHLKIAEGDYAILVGMHVTSRETKSWTWQTFWWSANADQPFHPSSAAIAAARPLQVLDEASRHYAMSVAYQMVSPAQPIAGGKSVGEPVFGYNPHLEASFTPDVFQIQRPILTPKGPLTTTFGVQSNCMTCHNQALYNPKTDYAINHGQNRETPYGADYYMSLDDPLFKGSLKLDFAWSILGKLTLDGSKGKAQNP